MFHTQIFCKEPVFCSKNRQLALADQLAKPNSNSLLCRVALQLEPQWAVYPGSRSRGLPPLRREVSQRGDCDLKCRSALSLYRDSCPKSTLFLLLAARDHCTPIIRMCETGVPVRQCADPSAMCGRVLL